jgi:hypothetical protein
MIPIFCVTSTAKSVVATTNLARRRQADAADLQPGIRMQTGKPHVDAKEIKDQ